MVSQAPRIATGPTRRHDEPVQPLHLPARVRPVRLRRLPKLRPVRLRRLPKLRPVRLRRPPRVRPEGGRASATGGVRPGPGLAGRSQA